METYDTLVQAINALRLQGYVTDFNLAENCLKYENEKHSIFHDEFEIDKFFRFEGSSNPDDCSILYAISSAKYGVRGILVNAYSIYSDSYTDEIMAKFK